MTEIDRVLLATPRSFCAGVEMAIKALAWMVRLSDSPVYCYHEIVHNRSVVDRFRRAGVVFVDDIEQVPPGAPLMLSAHGSAPEVVAAARARSDAVVDAVCPLVKKVHHEVRQRADRGHVVVYAGHPGHDEAVGTLAVAPETTHLVRNPDDVADLDRPGAPVAFLAQTTLAVEEWQATLAAARDRFGDVWLPRRRDLCFATTNRQAAVKAMAPRCDAVVVIGSANSSNTLALAKVARTAGAGRVLRVNGPEELPVDLRGTVGLTAGASAPEELVSHVLARLAPRDGTEVVDVTIEDEYFPPPKELRELLRAAGSEELLEDDRSVAAGDVLLRLGTGPEGPVGGNGAGKDGGAGDPAPPETATAAATLAACTEGIDGETAALVDEEVADPWLVQAIRYHIGLPAEDFAPPGVEPSRGKKLRAGLAVLACRAEEAAAPFGDDRPPAEVEHPDRVVPLAAAIELLHDWSLVHDDIEDGDHTRRGRPALWTICGEAQAINVGDCIHALALRCLGRLRDRSVPEPEIAGLMTGLARVAVELTVGQMRDLAFETTVGIDQHRYLEMIEGKTGALMSFATYAGALVGAGSHPRARVFGEFGRQLGLGFQIRDDVLGIWGTDSETGKPTGADIRRRKKSLPVVLALEHAPLPDRDRLRRLYAGDEPLTSADEHDVRRILDACDARGLAQQQARRHRAAAVDALDRLAGADDRSPAAPHFAALRALAELVTERTR